MKHENIIKIYHKDTDCYGIVWHGAYIKWFEIGRVELSHLAGIDFKILDELEILMPVVELNCRYKSPAKLLDELCITTEIKELKKTSITFLHVIKNNNNDNLILNATTTIVTTDKNGKLYRNMPDFLYEKFNKIFTTSTELNLI
ncbi:MAG: thioesterase family protein [Candidatus Gastranaerophilales bacterium]|nr:thioesterase family protein [Candidatus Gastranaerophilales bacterium]